MKKVLIVKNVTREGQGLLARALEKKGFAWDETDLSAGGVFPDPGEYDGVVLLGGPDSANDETAKMKSELEGVERALSLGRPFLGICLGMQVLVKVTGGRVVKSKVKEIGFRGPDGSPFKVELTEAGKSDALFAGLGDSFRVFQLHGETVELGVGIDLLGTGEFCRVQALRAGAAAYGLQCHFEMTPEMFRSWLAEDDDLKTADAEALIAEFESIRSEYTGVGMKLMENFLGLI
ncbi:MAG TPA: type 1 glutamine amidotransferase [bacterium]|nr:type 1 glutamine amidotransferase [bacterium]